MEQKVKIYRDIVCLEVPTRNGGKWWYQSGSLAFSPFPVSHVFEVQTGVIAGNRRRVAVVRLNQGGKTQWVAINPVRSDIPALQRRGLWPEGFEVLIPNPVYSPYPEEAPIDLV